MFAGVWLGRAYSPVRPLRWRVLSLLHPPFNFFCPLRVNRVQVRINGLPTLYLSSFIIDDQAGCLIELASFHGDLTATWALRLLLLYADHAC